MEKKMFVVNAYLLHGVTFGKPMVNKKGCFGHVVSAVYLTFHIYLNQSLQKGPEFTSYMLLSFD